MRSLLDINNKMYVDLSDVAQPLMALTSPSHVCPSLCCLLSLSALSLCRYVDLSDLAQMNDPDRVDENGRPINAWESQVSSRPALHDAHGTRHDTTAA